MLLIYILVFLFGLIIGSFLNVVISRLDRKAGLFMGRSECPECLTKLKWYDLFPVLSYLQLKGKCRYCRKNISAIYPIVEIATAGVIVFYFVFNSFGMIPAAAYNLLTVILLTVLFFFDFLYYILPDKIIILLISSSLLFNIIFNRMNLYNFMLSGFLYGAFFAIIYLLSKGEWMGLGDAKLALAIGLILGYPLGFIAIVLSIWLAAIWGILMMVFQKATLKTALPFGSFLSVIVIIFIIFQNEIQKIQIINSFF